MLLNKNKPCITFKTHRDRDDAGSDGGSDVYRWYDITLNNIFSIRITILMYYNVENETQGNFRAYFSLTGIVNSEVYYAYSSYEPTNEYTQLDNTYNYKPKRIHRPKKKDASYDRFDCCYKCPNNNFAFKSSEWEKSLENLFVILKKSN